MRRGFTLLEVLLASIMLGFGLAGILVALSQGQRLMRTMPDLIAAQEVMDLGDMAYPLSEVKKVEKLDVREQSVDDLWRTIVGDQNSANLTREQREKYYGFTWSRQCLDANLSDDDLMRLGNLRRVRVTVEWGDRFRGIRNSESYVTVWRDPEG